MAITRADLLKELMPGLNALFDLEYSKYSNEIYPLVDPSEYTVEVNFDDTVQVRDIRNDDGVL